MSTLATPAPIRAAPRPLRRTALADARLDRLFFAQVREDPGLELAALRPTDAHRLVVVSSGGCTALSLLAAGAGQVTAVDLNSAQNHLVELKAAAVAGLTQHDAVAFVGGTRARATRRRRMYGAVRRLLSPAARRYWDRRPGSVSRGVIDSGVTERFLRIIVTIVRAAIHGDERISRLLSCSSLDEQRRLYEREWNSGRWRLLFRLLLNRWVFARTYDPAFFEHVVNASFAAHFHAVVERCLTDVPIATNYFVHHMLIGLYPADVPDGLPPYLAPDGARIAAAHRDRLSLIDGSLTAYLRTCPDASIDGFAVSNICEWLSPVATTQLLKEIVRTAAPSARLCFRNFVGWTEVPEEFRTTIHEDRGLGETLIRRDRSAVQRRFAVCTIGAPTP